MSESQAIKFASTYHVVDRYFDAIGLSATIFATDTTGETFLAIRGTEEGDLRDLLTDLINITWLGDKRCNRNISASSLKLPNGSRMEYFHKVLPSRATVWVVFWRQGWSRSPCLPIIFHMRAYSTLRVRVVF